MPEEVSRTRLIRFTVTAYYEPDPRDYEESDGYGGVVKLLGYNPTVEAMAAFDKYTVDEGGMTPHDITCEKVERDDTEYKFEVVDFIRWDDGSVTEEVVKVLEDHVIDFDEEPDKPSKGVVHEDRVQPHNIGEPTIEIVRTRDLYKHLATATGEELKPERRGYEGDVHPPRVPIGEEDSGSSGR